MNVWSRAHGGRRKDSSWEFGGEQRLEEVGKSRAGGSAIYLTIMSHMRIPWIELYFGGTLILHAFWIKC